LRIPTLQFYYRQFHSEPEPFFIKDAKEIMKNLRQQLYFNFYSMKKAKMLMSFQLQV